MTTTIPILSRRARSKPAPPRSPFDSIVPHHKPADLARLAAAVHNHRVLFIQRGAVIALTTLVSIFGALFFHSVLATLFILASIFGFRNHPLSDTLGGGSSGIEGGSGYMVVDDTPPGASEGHANGSANPLAGVQAGLPATPAPPPLTPLPNPSTADVASDILTPPVIPLTPSVPDDLGTVKVAPRAVAAKPASAIPNAASPVTGVANPRGKPSGIPSGDEFGDEPTFSLTRGDASGSGSGRGFGNGNGLDRGLSAANRPAQPLSFPTLVLPSEYSLRLPAGKKVAMNVYVSADGLIIKVTIEGSCGIPEVDELARQSVIDQMKFSPAYRSGKPVDSIVQFTQGVGARAMKQQLPRNVSFKRMPQGSGTLRRFERLILSNPYINGFLAESAKFGLACLVWPRFVAPYRWELTRYPMRLANLDPVFSGFTILQLTDLHVGKTRVDYLAEVFERTLEEKPDLVVITGDVIDYQPAALPKLRGLLKLLAGKMPVLAIFGNHDYHEYSWRHIGERSARRAIHKRLVHLLLDCGIHLLRNEQYRVTREGKHFTVVGMDEMWTGRASTENAFKNLTAADPVLCLQHNPDGVEFMKLSPWSTMICGHSHGGQALFPLVGPLYVPMEHRHYLRGFFHFPALEGQPLEHRTMFVSRGLGHTTPIRMRCRPEATLFRLTVH